MRRSTSRLSFVVLYLLAPAVFAAPPPRPPPPAYAEAVAHEVGPRPATQDERQRYQEREQEAAGLD